jgi:hypothetical protein
MTDFSAWGHNVLYNQPGSSDGTLINNYITITVAYQSFMNTDFSDVRFALSDGTLLSHNRVSYTASSTAVFHVLIPSLPSAGITLTVCAGNSSATDISNPSAVYLFNENGVGTLTDKWTVKSGTATYTTVGGKTCVNFTGYTRTNTFQQSVPFKMDFKIYISSGHMCDIGYCKTANDTGETKYNCRIDSQSGNGTGILKDGGWLGYTNTTIPLNTWIPCTLTVDQNHLHTLIVNGVTVASATNSTYSTGYFSLYLMSGVFNITDIYVSSYTAHPPTVGTFGSWEATGCVITVPPAIGTLTANPPTIVLGGGITITVPPAGAILTANLPTLQALFSSPPAIGTLLANAPIIAFLMEVKAGVLYNPDNINDLKQDGAECNISFNVMIGDKVYE